MSLFKQLIKPDRQETRLAYEASYYPAEKLTQWHGIVWSRTIYLSKKKLQDSLINGNLITREGDFGLHWEYNNIPTEIEWNKYLDEHRFCIHLRISPLIKSNNGRVAVISF